MTDARTSLAEATALLTAPGQLFEIHGVTVDGVVLRAWRNAPDSLRQVLELSRRHGPRDFLVYETRRVTFEEHYRLASTLAHRLLEIGIRKGDRVAIAARNSPDWICTFWAAACVGAVVVPLNAWWSLDELEYGLDDSGARVLLVDRERLQRLGPVLSSLGAVETVLVARERPEVAAAVQPGSSIRVADFDSFVGDFDPAVVAPEVPVEPDDTATMFYTSGTTGRPKGALGTHRNAITNLMNLYFVAQRNSIRWPVEGAEEPSASLLSVPLFHATGCLATMLSSIAAGGKLVMAHHFDAEGALSLIQAERLTHFGGVPTIVMQVLDHPGFSSYDTSSVRSVSYGGAPAPPELVERIRRAFPRAQPGNGYGLTETSAALAFNSGPDYVAKPQSCGPPVPVCDVAIVPAGYTGDEPPDDRPRGPDVLGELWVKGPNVVRGYWQNPEATAASFTKGWLHTGDVARLDDDGFLYIVDRSKDMIIRGGENVYSIVVEAALFEHPDVIDCAIVGLAHPTLGEEVAAVVVLRPGQRVAAEDLSRHLAHRLANFEVPTRYFFRAEGLPRNPQGKVLKHELRASLASEVRHEE